MANDPLVFKLKVTLLEDLHSGTGTGNLLIDDLQARNAQGLPCIDREHFRGVLKDNALRLRELGHITQEKIERLFGKAGGGHRSLDCSSLVATEPDCLITWSSTARREGSRCPEDHSLRTIEYIKAGTQLEGWISINAPKAGDQALLEKLLRFTTRLGGGRTRGDGQIMIVHDPITPEPCADNGPTGDSQTLRLRLRAEEPLCIPTTGYPGNIIPGESHIPGRLLFGALCRRVGRDHLTKLFTSDLQVGNALPLPNSLAEDPHAEVIPMPAHLYQLKPAVTESPDKDLRWPHWARPPKDEDPAPPLQRGRDVDFLSYRGKTKTSRPKGHLYLVKDSQNNWRRYRQPLEVRMRNHRGDPVTTDTTRKETDLFTVERIPAGTYFVAEIHCSDPDLRIMLWPLLQPDRCFQIGRGKAPVRILEVSEGTQATHTTTTDDDTLTLLALSDWLILGENLGYLTALNKHTLLGAFGIDAANARYAGLTLKACQETETHGSYNYATRLPRLPQAVIRRGSVFRLQGDPKLLDELRNQFLKHGPIGERVTEGYGRFLVDPPLPAFLRKAHPAVADTPASPPSSPEDGQTAQTEADSRQANPTASRPPAAPDGADDACADQAHKEAQTYFEEHLVALRDSLPPFSDWQPLKAALIETASPILIWPNQPSAVQECFHSRLKTNSLFQTITKLEPPPGCDRDRYKALFLNALETCLYGGASQ